MRRNHAIALLATAGTLAALAASQVHPAAGMAGPPCTAAPGRVTLTSTGLVKAGRTRVTCAGRWTLTEGIQYRSDSASRPGVYSKWIFGGTKLVSGSGDETIPPFKRPYHECGDWRLHVVFASGDTANGPVSWFCS